MRLLEVVEQNIESDEPDLPRVLLEKRGVLAPRLDLFAERLRAERALQFVEAAPALRVCCRLHLGRMRVRGVRVESPSRTFEGTVGTVHRRAPSVHRSSRIRASRAPTESKRSRR